MCHVPIIWSTLATLKRLNIVVIIYRIKELETVITFVNWLHTPSYLVKKIIEDEPMSSQAAGIIVTFEAHHIRWCDFVNSHLKTSFSIVSLLLHTSKRSSYFSCPNGFFPLHIEFDGIGLSVGWRKKLIINLKPAKVNPHYCSYRLPAALIPISFVELSWIAWWFLYEVYIHCSF